MTGRCANYFLMQMTYTFLGQSKYWNRHCQFSTKLLKTRLLLHVIFSSCIPSTFVRLVPSGDQVSFACWNYRKMMFYHHKKRARFVFLIQPMWIFARAEISFLVEHLSKSSHQNRQVCVCNIDRISTIETYFSWNELKICEALGKLWLRIYSES